MKNRILRCVCSAFLIICITAMNFSGVVLAATPEAFEGFQNGASITTGGNLEVYADSTARGSSVTAAADVNGNAAKIHFDAGSAFDAPYLKYNFDEAIESGTFQVDFKMKYGAQTQGGKLAAIVQIVDEDDIPVGKVNITANKRAALQGGIGVSRNNVNPGTWYTFSLVFNITESTYGLSVNSENMSAVMTSTTKGIAGIKFSGAGDNPRASDVYVDDISYSEYGGAAKIATALIDGATVSGDVSADAAVAAFTFENPIEAGYANQRNITVTASENRSIDLTAVFAGDYSGVDITFNEKLDYDTEYTVTMNLSDFAATSYKFKTAKRAKYIEDAYFADGNDAEITNNTLPTGTLQYKFKPSADGVAMIMLKKGGNLIDAAAKKVVGGVADSISITMPASSSGVTAYAIVFDSFVSGQAFSKMASLPLRTQLFSTVSGGANAQISADKLERRLSASVIIDAPRQHQLTWFIYNPLIGDYAIGSDDMIANISSVLFDAGVSTLGPDNGNKVALNYNFLETVPFGRYSLYAYSNETALPPEYQGVSDLFYDRTAENQAIAAIKGADETNMGTQLLYYTATLPVFNIDLDNETYKTYTAQVHKAMIAEAPTVSGVSGIEALFDKAVEIVKVNHMTSGVYDYLKNNNATFGLSEITYTLSGDSFDKFFTEKITGGALSLAELEMVYDYANAMNIINNLDSSQWSKYADVLAEYNGIYQLDLTKQKYLDNLNSVYEAFVNTESADTTTDNVKMKSVSDVQYYFEEWLKTLEPENGGAVVVVPGVQPGGGIINGGVGGGSIGGGGGGGGSAAAPLNKDSSITAAALAEAAKDRESVKPVFNDINGVQWAEEAIIYLFENNVISGYEGGVFKPENDILREEAAKMISVAFKLTNTHSEKVYLDVKDNEWYTEHINAATAAGVINGKGELFGIGEQITRADTAVILYRIMKLGGYEAVKEPKTFADSKLLPEYAVEAVGMLAAEGIVNGRANNCFEGTGFINRAEFSKMLYNVMMLMEGSL